MLFNNTQPPIPPPGPRFTQEEIMRAYQQMCWERAEEYHWAGKVADYLNSKMSCINKVFVHNGSPYSGGRGFISASPYKILYTLRFGYSQYDDPETILKCLESLGAKTRISPVTGIYGRKDHCYSFEFDVTSIHELAGCPQNKYTGQGEQYDSHACGY